MATEPVSNPYANNSTVDVTNAQVPSENGLAIASLILGILSIFFYFLTAIPGIITGHMARSRVKNQPEKYTGKGMALAGLILSYIMLIISVVLVVGIIYMFNSSPEFKDAFMQGMEQGIPKQQ